LPWDSDPDALARAAELARKAIFLDDSNSTAYAILAWVSVIRIHPEQVITQAVANAERAIALDPNNAFAYLALSHIWGVAGSASNGPTSREKFEAQLAYAQKGMRLDPSHPDHYLYEIGYACLGMKRVTQQLPRLTGKLPMPCAGIERVTPGPTSC